MMKMLNSFLITSSYAALSKTADIGYLSYIGMVLERASSNFAIKSFYKQLNGQLSKLSRKANVRFSFHFYRVESWLRESKFEKMVARLSI